VNTGGRVFFIAFANNGIIIIFTILMVFQVLRIPAYDPRG